MAPGPGAKVLRVAGSAPREHQPEPAGTGAGDLDALEGRLAPTGEQIDLLGTVDRAGVVREHKEVDAGDAVRGPQASFQKPRCRPEVVAVPVPVVADDAGKVEQAGASE